MAARESSPKSTTSTLSNITVQTEKVTDACAMSSASPLSSTPPTSLDGTASVRSDRMKVEHAVESLSDAPVLSTPEEKQDATDAPIPAAEGEGRRPARNSRKSVTTYNVQILAGTAIHTPTKYLEKHHKNVLHGSLEEIKIKHENPTPLKKKPLRRKSTGRLPSDSSGGDLEESASSSIVRASSRVVDLRKDVLRNLVGVGDAIADAVSGTLRRSASDSRLNSSRSTAQPEPRNRSRDTGIEEAETSASQDETEYLQPKTKTYLRQGLFVGQHREFNPRLSENQNRNKRKAKIVKESTVLPLPLFTCDRLLNEDPRLMFRDFKLPFDTYNPLPRKVKVEGWTKLGKNRFIGDASSLWKRDKQDASQCYCEVEDGCGEACHNRIMAYECNGTNCRLTPEQCGNRPFAELRRRAKGNRYDYGVEVCETDERGYGVRAMRTFEAHQIIVEYAGEIITQQECERRMKQVYKKDKCYYLMSFDNKMIIDATRGTIARFVNHSCEPNCEMVKWNVGDEPRMALFAGKRGILTGEELTYDYNFDPFSQKNIQECRCGTRSCRGVLGPKPKKPAEEKPIISNIIAGTKRKIQDLFGSGKKVSDSRDSPKKRKLFFGNSAEAKARNAAAEVEAARERVQKEASEHTRQTASRENRALARAVTVPKSKRARAALLNAKVPAIKVKASRQTVVTFPRKLSKRGSDKKTVEASISKTSSSLKRPTLKAQARRHGTPVKDESMSDPSDDDDVNITPASLRSASKKLSPKSPSFQERIGLRTSSAIRGLPRGAILKTSKADGKASRGLHKTGAGIKKGTARA